jgi:hypothetical protein
MIARSDAVSFWVGKASVLCSSGAWHGSEMFGGTILAVGCDIGRCNLQWQASAILCLRAVYVLRTFFKLWLPQQNGIGGPL